MPTTLVPTTTVIPGEQFHNGRGITGVVIQLVIQDGLGIHQWEDGINLTFPKRTLKNRHIKQL